MTFYTYFHTRNDTNTVFYVGKGMPKHARAFDEYDRGVHWKRIVAKHGHTVHIAARWPTEAEAFEHEKFLIACFRDMGIKLVNLTDGGEGISGYQHTAAARNKIQATSLGRHHSLETIQSLSSAASAQWADEEGRLRKIAGLKIGSAARWAVPGAREQASKNLSAESRERIRLANSGDLNSSKRTEVRAKMSESAKLRAPRKHTEASKLKMRIAARNRVAHS